MRDVGQTRELYLGVHRGRTDRGARACRRPQAQRGAWLRFGPLRLLRRGCGHAVLRSGCERKADRVADRVGGERARPLQQHSGAPGRAAVAGSAHSLGGRQGRHGLALALRVRPAGSWQPPLSPTVCLFYTVHSNGHSFAIPNGPGDQEDLGKEPRRRASASADDTKQKRPTTHAARAARVVTPGAA